MNDAVHPSPPTNGEEAGAGSGESPRSRGDWKRMVRFLVSIVIGIVLLVLVFYNVDFGQVLASIRGASVGWWAVSAIIFIFLHAIRALRWHLIVKRIKPITYRETFSITCVGFMAIQALPIRES